MSNPKTERTLSGNSGFSCDYSVLLKAAGSAVLRPTRLLNPPEPWYPATDPAADIRKLFVSAGHKSAMSWGPVSEAAGLCSPGLAEAVDRADRVGFEAMRERLWNPTPIAE